MPINLVSKNLQQLGDFGNFEADLSTWGFGFEDVAGTVERSLDQSYEGIYSLKYTSLVNEYSFNHSFAIGRATVEIGKKYLLTARIYVSSSFPISPRNDDHFEFKSDTFFGFPTQYNVLVNNTATQTDATDNWIEITQQIEITSGSTTFSPFITIKDFTFGELINVGGIIYVDRFKIYEYEDEVELCSIQINPGSTVVTNETAEAAADGSITVFASALDSIEYRINGGAWQLSNQFAGLAPGSYAIEVREQSNTGCAAQAIFTVQAAVQNFTIDLSVTHETILAAEDGSVIMTSTGGVAPYEYSIDGGLTYVASNIFINLAAGNYPVAVRDSTENVVYDNAIVSPGEAVFSGLHFTRNKIPFQLSQTGNAGEDNYRLFCEVLVEDEPGSGTFNKKLAMALTPELDGSATFYLQQAFAGLIIPAPPVKGVTEIREITDRSLLYKVGYGDLYDELESPEGYQVTNIFQAVLGGISKKQYPTLDYLGSYIRDNKRFLSWRPSERFVDVAQEEYLTFFNYDPDLTSIKLYAKAWYTDATESDEFFTGKELATRYAKHYEIPAGATFNNVSLEQPGKVLTKYQLWLQNAAGDEVSERITFHVSTHKKADTKYFMYLNSLGAYEVVRCTGLASEDVTFAKESMQAFLGHDYDVLSTPEISSFNSSYQRAFSYSTGYYEGPAGLEFIRSLFDLQLSSQVYDITGSARQRRLVLPGSAQVAKGRDSRYFLRFNCAEPFVEQIYTADQ